MSAYRDDHGFKPEPLPASLTARVELEEAKRRMTDGSYSTAQPAGFHHAKITRYGTITGGVRQTEADLQAAFAMGIHG